MSHTHPRTRTYSRTVAADQHQRSSGQGLDWEGVLSHVWLQPWRADSRLVSGRYPSKHLSTSVAAHEADTCSLIDCNRMGNHKNLFMENLLSNSQTGIVTIKWPGLDGVMHFKWRKITQQELYAAAAAAAVFHHTTDRSTCGAFALESPLTK